MQAFFEEFHGADLNRLAECLIAIRKAGLSCDQHTQAGINQSSGNVWVWNDEWAGCVACSVGFRVFWVYSCSECGEEHEFATYQEMEAFAEDCSSKYEGGCPSCGDEVEA